MIHGGDGIQERPRSRALAGVRELVEIIYGIERWRPWRGIDCEGQEYEARRFHRQRHNHGWVQAWHEPAPADVRRKVASASAAISRAIVRLRAHGFLDASTWAVRLSDKGARLVRDARQATVTNSRVGVFVTAAADSVTDSVTVTHCGCGAKLDAQRSTRRYCSAACRQAAYRMRESAGRAVPRDDNGDGAMSATVRTPDRASCAPQDTERCSQTGLVAQSLAVAGGLTSQVDCFPTAFPLLSGKAVTDDRDCFPGPSRAGK